MAALNIFKKEQQEKAPKPKAEKKPEKKEEKQQEAPEAAAAVQPGVLATGDSQLVRPHITEKATDLAAKNQYVFVVQPAATKKEIEKSVEKAYEVQVQEVRIVNVHAKKMRLGRTQGMKRGYKKAIVQIAEGQSIEILPT